MAAQPVAAVLAVLLAAVAPAWADERGVPADPRPMLLLPPTETGKPLLPPQPGAAQKEPERCVPALPCGTRLLGAARKNGAVELQVPALRW